MASHDHVCSCTASFFSAIEQWICASSHPRQFMWMFTESSAFQVHSTLHGHRRSCTLKPLIVMAPQIEMTTHPCALRKCYPCRKRHAVELALIFFSGSGFLKSGCASAGPRSLSVSPVLTKSGQNLYKHE
eukprot:scpid43591/ scgid28271/ 